MKLTFIQAGEVTAKGNICLHFDFVKKSPVGFTTKRVFCVVQADTATIPADGEIVDFGNDFELVTKDGFTMVEAIA